MIILYDQRLGITDREWVAGVKFGHKVGTTFISDSIIILGQIGILFVILSTMYGMKVEGSWTLLIVLIYITSISGVYLGSLVGHICVKETDMLTVYVFMGSVLVFSSGNHQLNTKDGFYNSFLHLSFQL